MSIPPTSLLFQLAKPSGSTATTHHHLANSSNTQSMSQNQTAQSLSQFFSPSNQSKTQSKLIQDYYSSSLVTPTTSVQVKNQLYQTNASSRHQIMDFSPERPIPDYSK